jgi:hypothetical protein
MAILHKADNLALGERIECILLAKACPLPFRNQAQESKISHPHFKSSPVYLPYSTLIHTTYRYSFPISNLFCREVAPESSLLGALRPGARFCRGTLSYTFT